MMQLEKIVSQAQQRPFHFNLIVKAEMYYLTKFSNETELRTAIDKYIHFYNYERFQERFGTKAPLEVRSEAMASDTPMQFPIAENKRIQQYKAKFAA